MSTATTRLALPYLAPAQAQKHVTVNEALRRLDPLVQISAKTFGDLAPPSSPADGDVYIPGSGAGGAWAGWDFNLAYYVDGGWLKITPRAGWLAFVESDGRHMTYVGAPSYWTDSFAAGRVAFANAGTGFAANDVQGALAQIGFQSGVFTPTFSFAAPGNLSVSYALQTGSYVKIGSLVFVSIALAFTPTFSTSSGQGRVSGLPFAVEPTLDWALSIRNILGTVWPTNGTQAFFLCEHGTSYGYLRAAGPALGIADFTTSNYASGALQTITANGFYRAAS